MKESYKVVKKLHYSGLGLVKSNGTSAKFVTEQTTESAVVILG